MGFGMVPVQGQEELDLIILMCPLKNRIFYDKCTAKEGNTEHEPFVVTQNQCWYEPDTASSPQLLKPCPKILTLIPLKIKNHLHFIGSATTGNFSIKPFN